jgi:hypothetical protein
MVLYFRFHFKNTAETSPPESNSLNMNDEKNAKVVDREMTSH